MSRPFRPRPLDIHKKLPIVRSVKDLDIDEASTVSRASLHSNAIAYSEAEPVAPPPTKRKAGEIPTPQFLVVDSYERDYQRTFVQPSSYVRCHASSRSGTAESGEYDLDSEDEDWLQRFNKEETVLSTESFEWSLYKLEILDFKARERAGAIPAFGVPVPVLLQQEAALEVLGARAPRPAAFSLLFNYWKEKRARWQKPILRRLQPAPPVNDTNPFNVFRPREKTHRPHTRRTQRRENDVTSFEKLRQVRCNLEQARTLLAMLQKREEKKRDLMETEATLQRTRITLKHDTELDDELLMEEWTPYSRKSAYYMNGHVAEIKPPCNDGATMLDLVENAKCTWRRRRAPLQARGRPSKRVTNVVSVDPVFLFVQPFDPDKLAASGIVPPLDPPFANGTSDPVLPSYRCHGRIGRGGRLIFDRWNPLTRRPIGYSSSSHPPPPRLPPDKVNVDSHLVTDDDGNLDKLKES